MHDAVTLGTAGLLDVGTAGDDVGTAGDDVGTAGNELGLEEGVELELAFGGGTELAGGLQSNPIL